MIATEDTTTANQFVVEFERILQALGGQTLQQGVIISPLLAYLQQQMRLLHTEIVLLETEINTAKETITQFEYQYSVALAELIAQILTLEAQAAKKKADTTLKESDKKAYQQVLNHYTNKSIAKDFEKTYTIILKQKFNYAI
jgi:hypothetical protein